MFTFQCFESMPDGDNSANFIITLDVEELGEVKCLEYPGGTVSVASLSKLSKCKYHRKVDSKGCAPFAE